MTRVREAVSLFVLALLVAPPAASVTIEELFEQPQVKDIKISPTGDYLAIRVFKDGVHSLLFMNRASLEVLGGLKYRGADEVGDFFWANHERVVAEVYEVGRTQEAPKNYGELFAVNYDGGKAESIFGYRSGETQAGSILRKKESERAWGEIIDPFPSDARQILISSTSMSESHDKRPVAMMLDVYTGKNGLRIHSAQYAGGTFLADSQGVIRLATGVDEANRSHVEGLPEGAQEWIEFRDTELGTSFNPLAIADDRKSAYVLDNINSDKVGLYKFSLDGSDYKQIYSNDDVDITSVNLTADGRSVYAMRIDKGYPSYLVFSKSHDEATILSNILQTFPAHAVEISSQSDDGRYWVVHTSSDVDAGSFYLFNKDENTLKLLFRSMPAIKVDELSAVEPIEFESFDGLRITGYFTRAKSGADAIAPMVVLVHGGPRSRDYWRYDPAVQALATRGYSVLQINYRGSSGFGNRFLRAGNRQWGDQVQRDIISGTQWAIAAGKADKKNVCIMGDSFGAYSALQSAILEPDLFACAIANAGIFDLELLYKRGDITDFYWGDAYLEEVIGRDAEQLRQFSPVHNVAALKSPLLIAHGKRDQRAPYEHAQRLTRELDKQNKKYEFFVRGHEAHGFYDTDNQVEYMTKALAFLDKHLR